MNIRFSPSFYNSAPRQPEKHDEHLSLGYMLREFADLVEDKWGDPDVHEATLQLNRLILLATVLAPNETEAERHKNDIIESCAIPFLQTSFGKKRPM